MRLGSNEAVALLIAYGPEYRAFVQSGLLERLRARRRVVLYSRRPLGAEGGTADVEALPFPVDEGAGRMPGPLPCLFHYRLSPDL